jgi:hypothetical protein
VLGFVVGAFLFATWLWYRQSQATIFATIRGRMAPEGESAIPPRM